MLRPTNEHIRKRAEELNVCSKWNRVSARSLSVVIARSPVVYPLCVSSDFPLEWQRSRHRTSRLVASASAHCARSTVLPVWPVPLLLQPSLSVGSTPWPSHRLLQTAFAVAQSSRPQLPPAPGRSWPAVLQLVS